MTVGKLFNLLVVYFLIQNGLHGTKQLSTVLLLISTILSYLLCGLNTDTLEMLLFPMLLELFGIGDSFLWPHQLPLSKICLLIHFLFCLIFSLNLTFYISLPYIKLVSCWAAIVFWTLALVGNKKIYRNTPKSTFRFINSSFTGDLEY